MNMDTSLTPRNHLRHLTIAQQPSELGVSGNARIESGRNAKNEISLSVSRESGVANKRSTHLDSSPHLRLRVARNVSHQVSISNVATLLLY